MDLAYTSIYKDKKFVRPIRFLTNAEMDRETRIKEVHDRMKLEAMMWLSAFTFFVSIIYTTLKIMVG